MGVSFDLLDPTHNIVLDLSAWPGVPNDEVLTGQLAPGQFGLLGEIMFLGQRGEDALGPQIGRLAFGPLRIADNESHVQPELANGFCMVDRFAFDEIDMNARVFLVIAAE